MRTERAVYGKAPTRLLRSPSRRAPAAHGDTVGTPQERLSDVTGSGLEGGNAQKAENKLAKQVREAAKQVRKAGRPEPSTGDVTAPSRRSRRLLHAGGPPAPATPGLPAAFHPPAAPSVDA